MKFQKSTALIVYTLSLLLVSCASDKEPPGGVLKKEFPAQKKAPANIEESLQPANPGTHFTGTEGSSIKLKKASLGKAFLMAMTLSSGENAPTRSVLMPKVVKFEFNGSELGMLEENYNSIYNEVPSGNLLQTFKVEAQDADTVTFRWNYGLATIPSKGFYVVSDSPDTVSEGVQSSAEVLPVTSSFLKSAQIRNNRLELRQLSSVTNLEAVLDEKSKKIATGSKSTSVQLDIALSPYQDNKRFQPRLSTQQNGVGYFEVAKVRKEQGPIDIFASRWDLSEEAGPITYKISKSAPPEAVEAMKEGVLYWNKVFKAAIGREVIKVETNADPDEPLQPRTVIVHWVPFATAGSAYANFQPDPLTGEITSGLVYQTSVFYLSGLERGRRYVNRGVENHKREVVASGFQRAEICRHPRPHAAELVAVNEGLDEKMSQKFALDYLRHVVAHEVGHTLGLRHNFAGSLASELKTPEENRNRFRDYLNDPNSAGAHTSSSVMEYHTFRDSLMEGASLRTAVATYDQAAIQWGYGKDYIKPDDIRAPYFCTDIEGGGGKTFGCATGDSGPHPLAGHIEGVARNRSISADVILEALLDAIRPENENDALSIRAALAKNHYDKVAESLSAADSPHFFRLGSNGMKHIAVDRKLKGSSWVNEDEYNQETQKMISEEFRAVGGLPGILKGALGLGDDFKLKKGWMLELVRAKESAPDFGRGKNVAGKPFQLNEQEIRDLKAAAEKLAEHVEPAFVRNVIISATGLNSKAVHENAGKTSPAALMAYPEGKSWAPYVVEDSWQASLSSFANQIVTDSEGEVAGTVDGNEVKVPSPKFPIDLRMAALRFYSGKLFGGRAAEAWMKTEEEALSKALLERVAPVLKIDPANPDKAEPAGKDISKPLMDWAKKEQALFKALKTARK